MNNPRQRASDQNSNSHLTASPNKSTPEQSVEHHTTLSSDALIGINKDGHIVFINKTACKLTGWLPAQAENKPVETVFQLSVNSSIAPNKNLIRRIIESGQLVTPDSQQFIKSKNNKDIPVDFSLSPLDENTVVLVFHQRKKVKNSKNNTLLYQVKYDPLTRLSNRDSLQKIINNLHKKYTEDNKSTYSILLLDLDRFKLINDQHGHAVGDKILQLIAERIPFFIRDKDYIGRWAGEEFLCLLPDTDLNTAATIAERLRNNFATLPFAINDNDVFITTSIGIANYPGDGNSPEELFCIADATLYEAKKNGRNRVNTSRQLDSSIFSLGSKLENALNTHRLISIHQPIYELRSGKQVAEETLARIQEKDGELTEAAKFIDAAVKLQLVHKIDFNIIKSTISRCCQHYAENKFSFPHFVNVSADLLRRPELVTDILDFAKKEFEYYGLESGQQKPLVIEITEQELLHDVNKVTEILSPFTDFGFQLAIDDFGSGYSSLTYLAVLPINYLKFDGGLIKRIAYDERSRKIINGIQKMADTLELITIAEHIEDQITLDVLREIGVSWGQGHFPVKPATTE